MTAERDQGVTDGPRRGEYVSGDSRAWRLVCWWFGSPSLLMLGLTPTLRWVWTGDAADARPAARDLR